MARVVDKETIQQADLDYEVRRWRERMAHERALDERTEVTWVAVHDESIRCTNLRETAQSGRLMRCSEAATWQKMRVYDPGRPPTPVTHLCDAHSKERGRT